MKGSSGVDVGEVKKFGENLKLVKSTSGFIELRVKREGQEDEKLQTGWFNFYIESWRTVVEAYFGEDTGARVPAVMLLANHKLQKKTYEIKNPFDDDWEVCAMFGTGRPNGGISGDAFGKGILKVHGIVDNDVKQRIDGTFSFNYVDRDGQVVKVEADDFWAEFEY
ncbi:hypothetical protein ABV589_21635 [Pseudomonas sp. HOU2]|uniref:hypothetical protein n=1 Tax=Pseudomonas sp. HOU2 TaxID=3230301 RepID=UPI00345B1F59